MATRALFRYLPLVAFNTRPSTRPPADCAHIVPVSSRVPKLNAKRPLVTGTPKNAAIQNAFIPRRMKETDSKPRRGNEDFIAIRLGNGIRKLANTTND